MTLFLWSNTKFLFPAIYSLFRQFKTLKAMCISNFIMVATDIKTLPKIIHIWKLKIQRDMTQELNFGGCGGIQARG
jgi:hypothetical protein